MHEIFSENLRNPAHNRRAGLMRQFSSSQLYSISLDSGVVLFRCTFSQFIYQEIIEDTRRGISLNLSDRIHRYLPTAVGVAIELGFGVKNSSGPA
jgi:hypothetical protein